MKKFAAIISIILLIGSIALSSCNSQKTICPAYPPSTYEGALHDEGSPADQSFELSAKEYNQL